MVEYSGWSEVYVGNARFHAPHHGSVTPESHNSVTSSAIAWPLVLPFDCEIDAVYISITGSTGDAGATDMTIRWGMYDADQTTKYPSSLVEATGLITVNTTGMKSLVFATPKVVTAGTLYWLAVKKQNTPSGAAASFAGIQSTGSPAFSPYPISPTLGVNDKETQWRPLVGGLANGAFPATYTAGATQAFIGGYPLVYYTLSSIG